MTLYGFPDRADLELFDLLLTSSGVGPKLALAALRTHRADVLRTAIATADVAMLTAVPGHRQEVGRPAGAGAARQGRRRRSTSTSGGVANGAGRGRDAAVARRARRCCARLRPARSQAALADLDLDGDPSDLLRRALRALGAATGGR